MLPWEQFRQFYTFLLKNLQMLYIHSDSHQIIGKGTLVLSH